MVRQAHHERYCRLLLHTPVLQIDCRQRLPYTVRKRGLLNGYKSEGTELDFAFNFSRIFVEGGNSMRIFQRKPDVDKLVAKNDVSGLIEALTREDSRKRAEDGLCTLLMGKQGHYWVQLLFVKGLLDPNEQVRKSIAMCLSSVDTDAVRAYLGYLNDIERHGWAVFKQVGPQIPPDDMWTQTIPRTPDDGKLAHRVAQFRTWINLGQGKAQPPALKSSTSTRTDKEQNVERIKSAFEVAMEKAEGLGKSPAQEPRQILDDEVTIRCGGCGTTYTLGKNALVVSASSVMGDFAGVTIVGDGYPHNTKDTPDLVDSLGSRSWNSLHEPTMQKQKAEIDQILSALSKGAPRWWRCRNCGTVQVYRT